MGWDFGTGSVSEKKRTRWRTGAVCRRSGGGVTRLAVWICRRCAEPLVQFEDGRYVSARWPGDAYLLTERFLDRLG